VPFQILGIGMLFRTSYKMSDSIARSTGAVYRRAWRQVIYAALVVLGAWIGQHWGVAGVAWGALAALTINFVLMADLSLDVAKISWREFWGAHRSAVVLTVASFPVVLGATVAARQAGLPALLVLIAVGAVQFAVCGLLIWRLPDIFLGRDGQWMLDTMRAFVGKRSRQAVPPPGAQPALDAPGAGENP
jgi:PST family polysaccharide transporter